MEACGVAYTILAVLWVWLGIAMLLKENYYPNKQEERSDTIKCLLWPILVTVGLIVAPLIIASGPFIWLFQSIRDLWVDKDE